MSGLTPHIYFKVELCYIKLKETDPLKGLFLLIIIPYKTVFILVVPADLSGWNKMFFYESYFIEIKFRKILNVYKFILIIYFLI